MESTPKVKNDQNVNVEEKTDEKTVENESTNICNTVEIKPEKTEEISKNFSEKVQKKLFLFLA